MKLLWSSALITETRSQFTHLRTQITSERRLKPFSCQSFLRESESWRAASCINTPNLRSLFLSCVLVGWFESSRPVLWIMKSVKPPLTFTRQDAYTTPSSLPCLRVSPPLGTCCFKDGQQSEELLAVMKFGVRSLERHLSASWGHADSAGHLTSDACWGGLSWMLLFLLVLLPPFVCVFYLLLK